LGLLPERTVTSQAARTASEQLIECTSECPVRWVPSRRLGRAPRAENRPRPSAAGV